MEKDFKTIKSQGNKFIVKKKKTGNYLDQFWFLSAANHFLKYIFLFLSS